MEVSSPLRSRTVATFIFNLVLVTVLAGCANPEFRFSEQGPVRLVVGEQFSNPASRTRGVSYRSINSDVASVTANGTVNALSVGRTEIVAALKLDDSTREIRYSIEVINRTATLSAWVGPAQSQLRPALELNGIEIAASSDPNCNFNQVALCRDGQFVFARGSVINDRATTLSHPGFYRLGFGHHRVTLGLGANRFPNRFDHQAVAFKGRLWVIGGESATGEPLNDVWSSSDGLVWVEHLPESQNPPPVRSGHQVAVFNNKLWLIGGSNTSSVFSSENGIDWTEEKSAANFPARQYHQVIAFKADSDENEKLWLIGGIDADGQAINDVWSSEDGIDWDPHTELQATTLDGTLVGFHTGLGHQVVVFNNGSSGEKLWMFNGLKADEELEDDETNVNEIWSSINGVTWKQEVDQANYSARSGHQVVRFENGDQQQLWLIGGDNGFGNSVLWSSEDGKIWTQEKVNAEFTSRTGHQAVFFNDRMWLLAGDDGSVQDDVWATSNGVTWIEQSQQAAFTAREQHQAIVFNGQLWVIGGSQGRPNNEIWTSPDGLVWSQVANKGGFTARDGHQLAVFKNELWLVGGFDDRGQLMNDVWSSPDGREWTRQTSDAFPARDGHQLLAFDNQLWVFGGQQSDGSLLNDVWFSLDGVNWLTEDGGFTPRRDHQVIELRGQLWLFGGITGAVDDSTETVVVSDVWSSATGKSWRERSFDLNESNGQRLAYSARADHQMALFNGQLWMIGGHNENGDALNDIWTSSSGTAWQRQEGLQDFSPRQGHQVLTFNDGLGEGEKLLLIGGFGDQDYKNDVWSTTNGQQWLQGLNTVVEFPNR